MEPIRVIGRIDLAEQIHAALVAAGADARLATTAPMAVIGTTGRDDTGIDVLANGLDVCPAIKKAAPERPVVLITWDEPGSDLARQMAASAARTARGPDAHLSWPATGSEIIAACERAVMASRVRRPRVTWQGALVRVAPLLIFGGFLCAFVAELRAMRAGLPHGPTPWSRVVLQLAQAGIFAATAAWSWRRSRRSAHPRWHRGWAISSYVFAAFSVLGAIAAVLG